MGKIFLSFLLIILCYASCGEPIEPVIEQGISDDFVLEQRWNFSYVDAEGVIFGIPRSGDDPNPLGYVEFFNNGKGYTEYDIELLGFPFFLRDTIVWSRPAIDTIILQAVTEGKVDTWTILNATKDSVKAKWDINIAGNTATLTADLISN